MLAYKDIMASEWMLRRGILMLSVASGCCGLCSSREHVLPRRHGPPVGFVGHEKLLARRRWSVRTCLSLVIVCWVPALFICWLNRNGPVCCQLHGATHAELHLQNKSFGQSGGYERDRGCCQSNKYNCI